jgi:hypothetical protein
MTCDDTRRLLLDLPEEALRARKEPAVGAHVDACEGCREFGAALLAATENMRRNYDALQPRIAADEVATAVLASARQEATGAASGSGQRHTHAARTGRRAPGGYLSPLLAAAAAGVVIALGLLQSESRSLPDATMTAADTAEVPFYIEVPPDQRAIVFQTNDPNTTVVWFYSGD